MSGVRNYQKELDKIIEQIVKRQKTAREVYEEAMRMAAVQNLEITPSDAPTLFLHSCCAPCSSYVLEYLRRYFRITVFYYNPNIASDAEYCKRAAEQKRLIAAYNEMMRRQGDARSAVTDGREGKTAERSERLSYQIKIIEGDYEPECFYRIAEGLEQCPEGGERCFACYELRLRKTAERAKAENYDYFATTLTISPLKNAVKLNEIGEKLAVEYGVSWLPSDFKKRGGYQRSVALSKEYDLYRQDYCGCVYSQSVRRERLAL